MGRWARAFAFLVLANAILLLPGCAQNGVPAQNAGGSDAAFALPASDVSYYARYTVEEGGPMTKEVWRAPDKMRIDLSVQGMRALSFFFVDSRAYSCSHMPSSPACYDVSGTLSQADAGKLVPREADFSGAMQVESVKIGGTDGKCYETLVAGFGARKVCFAPQGVAAYDSYNVSRTLVHTEYLTDIEYYEPGKGPDAGVFALPAQPVAAPGVPVPPAPVVEE